MSQATSEHQSWVQDAVARFEGPLLLYATRLLARPRGSRDVVQDTFLKLCSSDFATIEGHLAEWLFTVCRNRALDVLRKENRMTQLHDEHVLRCASPDAGPFDAALRRDLASRALDLLEVLPPSQREVIRLKFQNGFSYQEISRISGHSVSNVGYLIHTGIKALEFNCSPPMESIASRAVRRGEPVMTIDPNDPRLTAFVLGELDPTERALVEGELVESAECRQAVEEIRLTARWLFERLQEESRTYQEASPGGVINHFQGALGGDGKWGVSVTEGRDVAGADGTWSDRSAQDKVSVPAGADGTGNGSGVKDKLMALAEGARSVPVSDGRRWWAGKTLRMNLIAASVLVLVGLAVVPLVPLLRVSREPARGGPGCCLCTTTVRLKSAAPAGRGEERAGSSARVHRRRWVRQGLTTRAADGRLWTRRSKRGACGDAGGRAKERGRRCANAARDACLEGARRE